MIRAALIIAAFYTAVGCIACRCARPPVHTTAEIREGLRLHQDDPDWNPRQLGSNRWVIVTLHGAYR